MKIKLLLSITATILLQLPVQALDLTGGNTITGPFSSASGSSNIVSGNASIAFGFGNNVGGAFNTAFGANSTLGGSSNFVSGSGMAVNGNFNVVTGAFNSTANNATNFNFVGGANNQASGQLNFLFGRRVNDGGQVGSFILGDSDAFGIRAGTAGPFTNITSNTFNGSFNGGYFLFTSDGQGSPISLITGAEPGLFIRPAGFGNTSTQAPPARVGINTIFPQESLHVLGGSRFDLFQGGSFQVTDFAPGGGGQLLGIWEATPGNGAQVRYTGVNIDGRYIDVGQDPAGNYIVEHNDVVAFQVNRNGNVGIGTTTPARGRLEVVGSVTNDPTAGNVGFFNPSATTFNIPRGSDSISIYATNFIYGLSFIAFSDERTKDVLGRSEGTRDLATLLGIEITDYRFKDVIHHGQRLQKKVVAQQVETVYPQAVSRTTEAVPDIYAKAKVDGGWVVLDTELAVGDRVRLISANDQGIHEVLEVREGAFRVELPQPANDEVFVYGREVNDFLNVDYDAIAMLNVSATQELYRIIQEKDERIAATESRLAAMQTLLTAMEAKDAARDAQLATIMKKLGDPMTELVSLNLGAAE